MPRPTSGLNPFVPPIRPTPTPGAVLLAAVMALAGLVSAVLSCPRVFP